MIVVSPPGSDQLRLLEATAGIRAGEAWCSDATAHSSSRIQCRVDSVRIPAQG